ncbi:MAG: hypothetical protein ABSC32_06680 [Steroidobacteraceae bacterium]|jgi:hypothetical protein
METLPGCLETHPHARRESAQDHRAIQPRDISALLVFTESSECDDEGLEIIEMRYQQALALMSLQDLFAEGQLAPMSR